MDANDWPTHLGIDGVVGVMEECRDSSQFDYEAGLSTEDKVVSIHYPLFMALFMPYSVAMTIFGTYQCMLYKDVIQTK